MKNKKFLFRTKCPEKMKREYNARKRIEAVSKFFAPVFHLIKRVCSPLIRYFLYQYRPDTRNVWDIPLGPGGRWNYWERRTQWGRILIWTVLIVILCLVI